MLKWKYQSDKDYSIQVLQCFNIKFLTPSNSLNECEWTEKSVAEVLMKKLEDVTWI